MDFKRIATIIGVAVIGYFGYYVAYIIYNLLVFLFAGPKNEQSTMALITAIIVAVVYTVKTRRQ
ncbi:hypothetical protein [Gemmiger sp.]